MDLALPDLSADEARDLTNRIRQSMAVAWTQIAKAYQGRAWVALGYESWDDYCDTEFDTKLRLPREERTMVVASLRDAGLSTRAIAAATGIDKRTVGRDLSGGAFAPPEPAPDLDDEIIDAEVVNEPPAPKTITGVDGKSYTLTPKPEPTTPRRSPLTDEASAAGWKFRKAAERLARIGEDDRLTANKDQVATHLRGHLEYAVEVCQDLLRRLDH